MHILCGLSYATRQRDSPADVVTRMVDIISRGHLPFLHTLDVQLTNEWRHCGPGSDQVCDDSLCIFPKAFWARIKEYCPRLRCITLKGIQYPSSNDSEAEDLGFLYVPVSHAIALSIVFLIELDQGITNLSIAFPQKNVAAAGLHRHACRAHSGPCPLASHPRFRSKSSGIYSRLPPVRPDPTTFMLSIVEKLHANRYSTDNGIF